MDFNELTYIETRGSLPSYFPVLRYFHAKTHSARDYESIAVRDIGPLMDFLNHMYYKHKGEGSSWVSKKGGSWKLRNGEL